MASHLQLLRVSKQVYEDVRTIFYGLNHFKFTNGTGWVALDMFLGSLTAKNRSLLRHITVRHPLHDLPPLPLNKFLNGILRLKHGSDKPHGVIDQHPWLHPYWILSRGQRIARVVSALEDIPRLKTLTLVLPCQSPSWWARIEIVDYTRVDHRKFENLTISIAALRCDSTLCYLNSSVAAAWVVDEHNNHKKDEPMWELTEIRVASPSPSPRALSRPAAQRPIFGLWLCSL